jgi:hypothetical protein
LQSALSNRPFSDRAGHLCKSYQAPDGWFGVASYRDIALALFGEARVGADWSDPRKYLFDQVRRAVRRGRALMESGYRRFLLLTDPDIQAHAYPGVTPRSKILRWRRNASVIALETALMRAARRMS